MTSWQPATVITVNNNQRWKQVTVRLRHTYRCLYLLLSRFLCSFLYVPFTVTSSCPLYRLLCVLPLRVAFAVVFTVSFTVPFTCPLHALPMPVPFTYVFRLLVPLWFSLPFPIRGLFHRTLRIFVANINAAANPKKRRKPPFEQSSNCRQIHW